MKAILSLFIAVALAIVVPAHPASAACPTAQGGQDAYDVAICVDVAPTSTVGEPGGGTSDATSPTGSPVTYVPVCPPTDCGGQVDACTDGTDAFMIVEDGVDGSLEVLGGACLSPADLPDPAPPQVTPGMVLAAFQRVPLPGSSLTIAPPGGRTLVGLDTILSTEAESFTETLTLLGQQVELDISPAEFTWHHGDGTSQSTDDPGIPYAEGRPMSDYVSHQYSAVADRLALRVDTTWSARFRVNGGPWQDVGDTVTIEGDAVALEVVEAEPNLVGS